MRLLVTSNVGHSNFCPGCGEVIESKLFDEHYRKCWLEGGEELSSSDVFDLVHNENNY